MNGQKRKGDFVKVYRKCSKCVRRLISWLQCCSERNRLVRMRVKEFAICLLRKHLVASAHLLFGTRHSCGTCKLATTGPKVPLFLLFLFFFFTIYLGKLALFAACLFWALHSRSQINSKNISFVSIFRVINLVYIFFLVQKLKTFQVFLNF